MQEGNPFYRFQFLPIQFSFLLHFPYLRTRGLNQMFFKCCVLSSHLSSSGGIKGYSKGVRNEKHFGGGPWYKCLGCQLEPVGWECLSIGRKQGQMVAKVLKRSRNASDTGQRKAKKHYTLIPCHLDAPDFHGKTGFT